MEVMFAAIIGPICVPISLRGICVNAGDLRTNRNTVPATNAAKVPRDLVGFSALPSIVKRVIDVEVAIFCL